MFSPCVFVCLFVSLSRCLFRRFNCEGLVPHKQYFAGTLLGMSNCASYVSCTHDVIGDVTSPQSRSNFESDISPSIFELESRSKAQNVGNAHGYLSGITSSKKVCHELKIVAILKMKYLTQLQFDLRYENIVPNYAKKVFSWWWRHRWRNRVASKSALYIPLSIYKWNNIWIHIHDVTDVAMLMAIFLVYSTSGITSGKRFVASSKWRPSL